MGDIATQPVKRAGGSAKRTVRIMTVVVVGLALCCGYLLVQYRHALSKQPKSDSQRIAEITQQVDSAVLLPDEKPTIATVADKNKLAEPQLAAQARNGDELLVYSKAKRVILYRPSVKKIVDMFRMQDGQSAASDAAATQ